jgi:hypothetical protein
VLGLTKVEVVLMVLSRLLSGGFQMSLSANRETGLPDFSHPEKVDLNWSKGYANLTSILGGLIVDNLEDSLGGIPAKTKTHCRHEQFSRSKVTRDLLHFEKRKAI